MNRLLALMFASSLVLASATASFADDKDKPATKPAPTKEPAKKDDKPAKPAEKPADKKDDKKPAMPSPEDMAKMWEKASAPGPMHAWLENLDGKWTGTAKELGFDGKMTESECSINNEMRYKRILTSTYQGKSMGQAYYGRGTLGYNNATKKFESTWYDNMSTATMLMTGTADAAGKVLTLTGTCADPMSGKPMNMRCVYTITGKDAYKIDIYADMTGKEELWQSMSFTREAAKPEAKKEEKHEKHDDKKPSEKPAPKKTN
jgi:hypothetical protein